MMEFVLLAYDGTDENALSRRMAVREAHMEYVKKVRANLIHGGALLDEDGRMIGSIIISTFPDRASFDEWLRNDPYVTGNVWQDIKVLSYRTAPSFISNIPKQDALSQH